MSAEMTVRVDGAVTTTSGGTAVPVQQTQPRVIPAAALLVGSGTVTDSVTPVVLVTIPAGKTLVGTVNVVANSRATTAAYGTISAVVSGGGVSVPAQATTVALAGSSRDAGACPVTLPLQVTATSGTVTVTLVASTATSFNGSGIVLGELV